MQPNAKNTYVVMMRSIKIFYQKKNWLKDTIIGAGDAGFRAGQIEYSVVNGSSPLRCFLGAVLRRR